SDPGAWPRTHLPRAGYRQRRKIQQRRIEQKQQRQRPHRQTTELTSRRGRPTMDRFHPAHFARTASNSSATMLVILIIGLTAGPAVSLYGSPTVSPVTAALWGSEPLPPWWPSSMYFLALSHAPPPEVIDMATK